MTPLLLALVLKIFVQPPVPIGLTINPLYPIGYAGRDFYALENLGVVRVNADTGKWQTFGLCHYGSYDVHPMPQLLFDGDHFQCMRPSIAATSKWLVASIAGQGSWHYQSGAPATGWHVWRTDGGTLSYQGVVLATQGLPYDAPYQPVLVGDYAWFREYSGTSTWRTVKLDLVNRVRVGPELPPVVTMQPSIDGVTYKWDGAQRAFLAQGVPATPTRTVTPVPVSPGTTPVCTVTPTCPCVTPTVKP